MKSSIRRGHHPTIIYNTNGYDLPETIRSLEGIVDVWLPDFKYSDDNLARELSQAPDYSRFALESLKAMVHQAGTTLHTDDRGIARRGIILRHLVLPGFVENSTGVLKLIAEHISPNLHISLMSQYYPPEIIQLENRKFETATQMLSRINPVRRMQSGTRKSQIANPYIARLPAVSTKPSSKHFMLSVSRGVGCRNLKVIYPTVPTSLKNIRLRHGRMRKPNFRYSIGDNYLGRILHNRIVNRYDIYSRHQSGDIKYAFCSIYYFGLNV